MKKLLLLVTVIFIWISAVYAGEVFSAVGYSYNEDINEAINEAVGMMMKQFKKAKKQPAGVIFLERMKNIPPAKSMEIGNKVKELAGGVPCYGHGGLSLNWDKTIYSQIFAENSEYNKPGFIVMGITAPGMKFSGYAVGGDIKYSYTSKKAPEDPIKLKKWETDKAREEKQREICKNKGVTLGQMIPETKNTSFIIFIGALHNNWHVTFLEGMRGSLKKDIPIVGGVGLWTDYVYNNGESLTDLQNKTSHTGQMAILIEGKMSLTMGGVNCPQTRYDQEKLKEDITKSLGEVKEKLNEKKAAAALIFECNSLLHESKMKNAGIMYSYVQDVLGSDTPIFGASCGGEVGIENSNDFSAGGDRFFVLLISDE